MSKVLPGSEVSMGLGAAEGHHVIMPGLLQKHTLTHISFLAPELTSPVLPLLCETTYVSTSSGMVKLTVTLRVSEDGDVPATILEERIGWCPVMLGLGQDTEVLQSLLFKR